MQTLNWSEIKTKTYTIHLKVFLNFIRLYSSQVGFGLGNCSHSIFNFLRSDSKKALELITNNIPNHRHKTKILLVDYYLDIFNPISVPKTKLSAKQPNSAIGDSTTRLTNIAVRRKLIAWHDIIGINFFISKFFFLVAYCWVVTGRFDSLHISSNMAPLIVSRNFFQFYR